jgi:hypothetical protein
MQECGFTFSVARFLSSASRFLRSAVLRRSFAAVHISSLARWNTLMKLSKLPPHIRYAYGLISVPHIPTHLSSRILSVPCSVLTTNPPPIGPAFAQLQQLSVSFETLPNFFGSTCLTSLSLTHVPRIDTKLLRLIASHFPSLLTLNISSIERLDYQCCWDCLSESADLVHFALIPNVYPSVSALSVCAVTHSRIRAHQLFSAPLVRPCAHSPAFGTSPSASICSTRTSSWSTATPTSVLIMMAVARTQKTGKAPVRSSPWRSVRSVAMRPGKCACWLARLRRGTLFAPTFHRWTSSNGAQSQTFVNREQV